MNTTYLEALTQYDAFDLGQIYLQGLPQIPQGYKFFSFKVPSVGEVYLTTIPRTLDSQGEYYREQMIDQDYEISNPLHRRIVLSSVPAPVRVHTKDLTHTSHSKEESVIMNTDYLRLLTQQEAYTLAVNYETAEPPSIPEGYMFVAFRNPEKREYFISANSCEIEYVTTFAPGTPRIIIHKIPTPTTVHLNMLLYKQTGKDIYGDGTITVPAEYEYADFRPAKEGEEYLTPAGEISTAASSSISALYCPRIIIRKR